MKQNGLSRNFRLAVVTISLLVIFCLKVTGVAVTVNQEVTYSALVPLAGNSYVTSSERGARVTEERGVVDWTGTKTVISIYFKVSNPGMLDLGIQGYIEGGESLISVKSEGRSFDVRLNQPTSSTVPVGQIRIAAPGYIRVDLQGKVKSGSTFGTIQALTLGNEAAVGPLTFVSSPEYYYWGRRGASVHMSYLLPSGNHEFFYNEVTVPEGSDIEGSYFMVNGFKEGYSGIQVNSSVERRILFSVWSPFKTDDPQSIPPNQKVVLVRKGENVRTGEFGNEGAGGQSFLIFPWKSGKTYKMLTRIRPVEKDSWGQDCTEYSCYFFDALEKRWMLIAIWKRPATKSYYASPHSFLENFDMNQGYLTRRVFYGNQWSRDIDGKWHELVQGRFTCDDTGQNGGRADYAGGSEGSRFFLKSFGFFDANVPHGTSFDRLSAGGSAPISNEELQQILLL